MGAVCLCAMNLVWRVSQFNREKQARHINGKLVKLVKFAPYFDLAAAQGGRGFSGSGFESA